MTRIFPALLIAAISSACGGTTANDHIGSANLNGTPVLPTTVTLTAGTAAEVASANLNIRFDSVTSDSRCPSNVQCIQAGTVTVALTVGQLSGVMSAQRLSLTSIAGRDTATSYGQPIRLLNVLPVRGATATQAGAYRVDLRVGK